jgi:diguanylate cyclase
MGLLSSSKRFRLLSLALGHLILGRDAARREHVRRLMRSVWMFGFACALLAVATAQHLTPREPTLIQLAYNLSGLAILYALVRSGWSARFADPSLAYPVLLFGVSVLVLAYAIIPVAQGAALQLLCLLLAFEMDRLPTRQLVKASILALTLQALASTARVILHPGSAEAHSEVWNLLMSAVLVPTTLFVGAEIGRLYRHRLAQRQALGRTLSQLRRLSANDALTGLANRRQMMSLMEQEIKRHKRGGQAFCVAILDIDWFKRVNDTHGHGVGDAVLQRFASLCREQLHGADALGRWGGEEFCLLMPASGIDHAMDILAGLRQAVHAHDWGQEAPGLALTFSAGVAQHGTYEPLMRTLERADQALYAAKAQGRDQALACRDQGSVMASTLAARVGEVASAGQVGVAETAAPGQEEPAPTDLSDDSSWHDTMGAGQSQLDAAAEPSLATASGRSWRQRLSDALIGSTPEMRDRMRLTLLAMLNYISWIVLVKWYALPSGLMDPTIGAWMMTCMWVGLFAFYPLIRSGWSARFDDAELMMVQMLVGACIGLMAYAGAPDLRPSVLHLMCVVQIFGMVNLRPWACMVAGVGTVGMMLGVVGILLWTEAPGVEPHGEVLRIVLASFIVWRLAKLSRQYALVREQVRTDHRQLECAVHQVQDLVIRDGLTGLFNRKHMQDLLHSELERFDRTGHRFCVALIDLDFFKRINDTYGHHVGDEVLTSFAKAAQGILRETDVIGRWGGEEFLVLMPDTDHATGGQLALQRLHAQLRDLSLAPSQPDLRVTFSSGVTLADPEEPIKAILERADQALYAAKAAGRDHCCMSDGQARTCVAQEEKSLHRQPMQAV